MCFRTRVILSVCAVVLGLGGQLSGQQSTTPGAAGAELSDREKDGLIGPVRRITVQSAKIVFKNGSATEGARVLREVTTYDPKGKKIDTVAYPIDGETLPGKEEYKYDDKGNIVEMRLTSQDGRLLSKELYKYQMDEVGNWKKMTTSLAVFQDGNISDEPIEVTYRTITYFYSQEIARLVAAGPANVSTAAVPALKDRVATHPTGSQRSGVPALEPRAPSKSDTKFTHSPESKGAIADPDMAKSTPVTRPTVLAAEAVPLSQKVSSADQTASLRDTETSSSALPVETLSTEDERKLPDSSPSGVPVSNADSTAERPPTSPPLSASDPNSLYRLGVSYLEAGKPGEAVPTLNAAIHKNPENALAYVKLGLAFSALRQYKDAIPVYKMAIQIRPDLVDAEAYYQLGQAYASIEKYSDAVAALKQAIYINRADSVNSNGQTTKVVPSAQELHYSLGLVYHRQGKFKEAIGELRIVIELNPRLAEAHFGLAVCHIALGDRRAAEKQQKILSTLNPAMAQKVAEALSGRRITPPGVTEGMLGNKRN